MSTGIPLRNRSHYIPFPAAQGENLIARRYRSVEDGRYIYGSENHSRKGDGVRTCMCNDLNCVKFDTWHLGFCFLGFLGFTKSFSGCIGWMG